MAQITGFISPTDMEIRYSIDGSSYTDISGSVISMAVSPSARITGEEFTFDGDKAALTSGKLQPVDITLRCLYVEGPNPWNVLRGYHQTAGGTALYLDWSMKGGDSGEYRYETDEGRITSLNFPQGEAAAGGPVVFELVVRSPGITQATI